MISRRQLFPTLAAGVAALVVAPAAIAAEGGGRGEINRRLASMWTDHAKAMTPFTPNFSSPHELLARYRLVEWDDVDEGGESDD